ncbi:glutamine amidotransferase [Porticoccaceae bacterium LTM1]|nr:glutamine amidotransferase [Porticoccaceae bacterium LTM1]
MSKPLLILQLRPEQQTSDSEFEAILKYGGLPRQAVQRLRIESTGIPDWLDLDDYCAVIVGGSPYDISTPLQEKSDIQIKVEQDFLKLLDQVVTRDFPFLGACSGNGLLGLYLGTPITNRYKEPVSCVSLKLTDEGKLDPLLAGFPDEVAVLLGHKEACEVTPEGATLLMKGEACPVQMFRVGSNVYATQFHPEGDPDGFITRIHIYKHHGYFEPHEAQELIEKVRKAKTPFAQEILKRFVARYCNQDLTDLTK